MHDGLCQVEKARFDVCFIMIMMVRLKVYICVAVVRWQCLYLDVHAI